MLPTLPGPRRHTPPRHRRAWRAGALAALALLWASGAWALGLRLDPPHARDGWVVVEARLDELFEDRVAQSLERGVPATIAMHAELWRRRGLWFGALENGFDATVRVRQDAWEEGYLVERRGAATRHFATLDSVAAYLERPWSLPVARLAGLHADAPHYVVVTVTLEPLSAEEAREVEGWMSGDASPGGGGVTALPRGVFDALRNVSGFGDRRARAQSDDFVPDQLAR